MSQNRQDGFFVRQERRITSILRIFQDVGMIFIILLMFLTVAHSASRYILNRPIPGTVELSSAMLVVGIFMFIAYTMIVKGHIAVGLVVDRFSARTQAIIDCFNYLVCLAVAVIALWQSLIRGTDIMEFGQVTKILDIPIFPFFYVIGVGWALFTIATLTNLVISISKAMKK